MAQSKQLNFVVSAQIDILFKEEYAQKHIGRGWRDLDMGFNIHYKGNKKQILREEELGHQKK